ncbi:hypothetical protein NE237_025829 [Protea cynaroides]|uniref:RNase H type-1 domain-containing protein n=1 Tax=Protea cynaroides TaxID=273540 RepID=A0A9Q0H5L2_9MAGN|nr:hypothetical protein NE237_025829 [Protea cynaroides]
MVVSQSSKHWIEVAKVNPISNGRSAQGSMDRRAKRKIFYKIGMGHDQGCRDVSRLSLCVAYTSVDMQLIRDLRLSSKARATSSISQVMLRAPMQGVYTNFLAELKGALRAIREDLRLSFTNIWLESDSNSVVSCLQMNSIPWASSERRAVKSSSCSNPGVARWWKPTQLEVWLQWSMLKTIRQRRSWARLDRMQTHRCDQKGPDLE